MTVLDAQGTELKRGRIRRAEPPITVLVQLRASPGFAAPCVAVEFEPWQLRRLLKNHAEASRAASR